MRLKSLYVGTLAAMVTILALSFLAFHAISNRMQAIAIDPVFDRADELQLESGRDMLNRDGAAALRDYMVNLNRIFGGSHYLLNARGIDLVTGENRSALLPPPPETKSRFQSHGLSIITHRSPDGLFWFAAVGLVQRPQIWTFLPYYFLVIGTTGMLCWLAAVGVVSPIRRIARTISIFGQGDLSVRVESKREDEIGQLGRSFNQMAERLEHLIMSERRLLGDISHELRSPLARLKFAVKLARTSSDSKAALDRVERDVDRITALVADIVDITFIEGDPALQGAETLSLSDVVAEVVRDCAVEAEIRDSTVEVKGRCACNVLGNRELLRRAIENVVRNGIRYSPTGEPVQIMVHETDRNSVVEVRDFGRGVPEATLSLIFDPFFRVEEARNTNGGGSGIGLAIAKRAVLLHHGSISAENARPGLLVKISIPVVESRS